jgi:hypothetical protein
MTGQQQSISDASYVKNAEKESGKDRHILASSSLKDASISIWTAYLRDTFLSRFLSTHT